MHLKTYPRIRNRIESRPAIDEAERNFSNDSGISLQAEWPGTFQQPVLKYPMGVDATSFLGYPRVKLSPGF